MKTPNGTLKTIMTWIGILLVGGGMLVAVTAYSVETREMAQKNSEKIDETHTLVIRRTDRIMDKLQEIDRHLRPYRHPYDQ